MKDNIMTLEQYINKRESILSTFECSVDVALKIHEKMDDSKWLADTIKKWHLDCTENLNCAREQFLNAPKPVDPFVDEKEIVNA